MNVVIGFLHNLQADAIRFALMVTTVTQLRLQWRSLRGNDRRLRQFRANARCEYGHGNGGKRRHSGLLLGSHHARNVALGDMSRLVSKNADKFRFTLRREDQPAVNADESARKRERVDCHVINSKELEVPAGIRTVGHQGKADPVQVVGYLGIVQILGT